MRAQTTLDFAVGAVIFLGVVGFVFLFVTSAVAPFTGTAEDDTVVANRIADKLATDLLGAPSEPYVLDPYCTREFFATLSGAAPASGPAECAYNGTTLAGRVGVTDRQNVNVSLRANLSGSDGQEVLCWNADSRALVESDEAACTSSDVVLASGDDPTGETSTITARRVVSLAERDVVLVVEVW